MKGINVGTAHDWILTVVAVSITAATAMLVPYSISATYGMLPIPVWRILKRCGEKFASFHRVAWFD